MNQPLSSNEQTKVALFFLSLLPTLGLGGGGFLIVAYGLYMLNKQADPSFIEVTRKLFTGYSKVICVLLLFVSVIGAYHNYIRVRDDIQESTKQLEYYTKERKELNEDLQKERILNLDQRISGYDELISYRTNTLNTGYSDYVIEVLLPAFIAPIIPILYIWMLHSLFYIPLTNHKEWVVANGIFATTVAKEKVPRTTPLIALPAFSIKTSSNLSVADELVKLSKLKEDGLVTQDEFDKLRKALLS
jgi:hypothetical protein